MVTERTSWIGALWTRIIVFIENAFNTTFVPTRLMDAASRGEGFGCPLCGREFGSGILSWHHTCDGNPYVSDEKDEVDVLLSWFDDGRRVYSAIRYRAGYFDGREFSAGHRWAYIISPEGAAQRIE